MKHLHRYIFLIFFLSTFHLNAQISDSLIFKKLVHKGINDGIAYVKAPFHWDKKDWLIAGSASAATVATMFFVDKPVYNFVNEHKDWRMKKAIGIMEKSDLVIPPVLIGSLMLASAIKKDNYDMNTAMIVGESFIINGILCRIVKSVSGRDRPEQVEDNPFSWNLFSGSTSFYSGHTSTSFALNSVFAYRYRHIKWVPWVAYGISTLSGIQRIYYNRHWTSDVLMGAVMGTATGIFLAKSWEDNSIQFYPQFGAGVKGISMVITIK